MIALVCCLTSAAKVHRAWSPSVCPSAAHWGSEPPKDAVTLPCDAASAGAHIDAKDGDEAVDAGVGQGRVGSSGAEGVGGDVGCADGPARNDGPRRRRAGTAAPPLAPVAGGAAAAPQQYY